MKKLRERIIKLSVISLIVSSHTWASAKLGDEAEGGGCDITFRISSKAYGDSVFLGMTNSGQLFKSKPETPFIETLWKHVEGSNSGNIQHVKSGRFLDLEVGVCAVGIARNSYFKFQNLLAQGDEGYVFLLVDDLWNRKETFCLDFDRLNTLLYELARNPKSNPGKRLKLTHFHNGSVIPFKIPFPKMSSLNNIEFFILTNIFPNYGLIVQQRFQFALSTGQFGKAYAMGREGVQDQLFKDWSIAEAKKAIKSLVRQQVYLQDVTATAELTQLMEGFIDTPAHAELTTYLETNRTQAQQLYSGFLANPQIQAITPEVKSIMLRQIFADMK